MRARTTITAWLATTVVAMAMAIGIAAPASASATGIAPTTITCMAITPECMGWPAFCKATGYRNATCNAYRTYATAPLSHIGWTYLNLNYCAPGMMCTLAYRTSMNAWRWTGTSWVRAFLAQGPVYVYPYTGSWRWAWTGTGGWVAVTGGRFELRY